MTQSRRLMPTNLTLGTGAPLLRLLHFARNDTANGCHGEERSDEAISMRGSITGVIRLVGTPRPITAGKEIVTSSLGTPRSSCINRCSNAVVGGPALRGHADFVLL
jgi:hypothetical protein